MAMSNLEFYNPNKAQLCIGTDTYINYKNQKIPFPIDQKWQHDLIFSEIMKDPEREVVAQAVTNLSKKAAIKKFRSSRVRTANKVLPTSPWKMLGQWKHDEQKRMFMTNATSNVRTIYQLAAKKDLKSMQTIPYLFEKLPNNLRGKDYVLYKSQFIQTCAKGFVALAKPLIENKRCPTEAIQLLNKFYLAYPQVEEVTEALIRLLLIKQDTKTCRDIYDHHTQILATENKEPSKVLKEIYSSLEEYSLREIQTFLSEVLPRYEPESVESRILS